MYADLHSGLPKDVMTLDEASQPLVELFLKPIIVIDPEGGGFRVYDDMTKKLIGFVGVTANQWIIKHNPETGDTELACVLQNVPIHQGKRA